MPWKDTNIMELRIQFITDWLKRTHTVSDLCALYGISRKSGHKWIDRYQHEGPDWVLDRSHAAKVIANKTPLEVEQALMQMRALHPTWGARKLLHLVGLQQPALLLPHELTLPSFDVVHSHSVTRLSLPGPRASLLRTSSG
jgi:transposase-like protein